jgi:outer membrane protein assembly factor BamB
MDNDQKIKLSQRAALISGSFCLLVALLLIFNFWHMKQHEPLESKSIEALVNRLREEPNNEALKKEIRDFDLLARKAYFTSRWQVRTGTWLLLFGGIVLAVSLKIHTDLRARIALPGEGAEEVLRARANAQYWLSMAGGLVLGFALVAGWLTNDYLGKYEEMASTAPAPGSGSGVEVIEVFPGGGAPADSVSAGEGGAAPVPVTEAEGETPAGGVSPAVTDSRSGAVSPAATPQSGPALAAPAAFNPADFKTNQATFRGYMGHGVAFHKNIPEHWNGPAGTNVKWKVALSRPGYNTPVIWGDRIFVSGADQSAQVVACYNRHTGQLLWEREVKDIPGSPASPPRVSDDTGLAAPTMAVDGKRVYAIFATGDVIAFSLDGNRSWARNLGVPNNHYGHASSLTVWGKRLVVQYDTNAGGRMLTLDTASGETLWDVSRPVHISWSSPVLIEVNGKIEIVTSADPYVMGNDLETGAELWKVEAMMGEVGPSVAYGDGLVFANNEYARLVAVEPKAGAPFTWVEDEYLSEAASPVAYNGLLFLATSYGVLVCYDAKTGAKYWEKEFSKGFYSSPMIADGKLYIIDVGGTTHIIRADRTGTVIAEPVLGEGGYSLPVFADGAIYLRGGSRNLYCIGD